MNRDRQGALGELIALAEGLLERPLDHLDPEDCLALVADYERRRSALIDTLDDHPFDADERALIEALLELDGQAQALLTQACARWRTPLHEARARQSALNNYRAPEAAQRTFYLKG